jgi:hypothetical protein
MLASRMLIFFKWHAVKLIQRAMKTAWFSKSIKITAALALAAAAIGFVDSANANPYSFSYASRPGSAIVFPGNHTFHFAPGTNDFVVTSGTASGDFGQIIGTFTIGTITPIPGGATAPVTGTGTFVIHDGTGHDLTASLTWVDITQIGTSGTLNIGGAINLTSITYTGTNHDLVNLRIAGSASDTLDFTFNPAVTLAHLRNGPGSHSTSFSGTVSYQVPDGGTAVALLGIALAGVGGVRRMFRVRKT